MMGQRLKITFMFSGSFSASTAWMKARVNSDPRVFKFSNLPLFFNKFSKVWKTTRRSVTICDWTWIWVKNARKSWQSSVPLKFSKLKMESTPEKTAILALFLVNFFVKSIDKLTKNNIWYQRMVIVHPICIKLSKKTTFFFIQKGFFQCGQKFRQEIQA